jgi:hypothetical protein
VIGGEDMYKPLCRECFNEETLAKEVREATEEMMLDDSQRSTELKKKQMREQPTQAE